MLWPTPEEEQEERRREKRLGDSEIGEKATTVGAVTLGAAVKVGVVALTTAVGVAEPAAAAPPVRVVGQNATIAAVQASTTGEVTAALGADTATAGAARESVLPDTTRRDPAARPLNRAPTKAGSPWRRERGK